MMDLLVQIATAHKLTASNYTLQAIGEHGLVLPHHPNTPIGVLDALQVTLTIQFVQKYILDYKFTIFLCIDIINI